MKTWNERKDSGSFMHEFLLIDFGTTRVKAALVDLDSGEFSHIMGLEHLPNSSHHPGQQEISVLQLQEQFSRIAELYYQKCLNGLKGIMLCSQMNGYALIDESNRPITDYVSWKDERSLTPIEGISSFQFLQERLGENFRRITGTKIRPSFPIANLLHMARSQELRKPCKAVSIPELICTISDKSENVVHPTMLANFGVYDIYRQKVAPEIVSILDEYSFGKVSFNSLASENEPGGYWQAPNGSLIPIFCGVGDHQCTVLGAGLISENTLSINLGTGSQAAVIAKDCDSKHVEQRPYFGGDLLSTITHIPAGRILEEHIEFLADVGKVAGADKKQY